MEVVQLLVQWKGKDVEDATWEDLIVLKSQFSNLNLGDKVNVEGGGIDRDQGSNSNNRNTISPEQLIHHTTSGPKAWLVYSRRGRMGKSG
jgi:hypothetical protein